MPMCDAWGRSMRTARGKGDPAVTSAHSALAAPAHVASQTLQGERCRPVRNGIGARGASGTGARLAMRTVLRPASFAS